MRTRVSNSSSSIMRFISRFFCEMMIAWRSLISERSDLLWYCRELFSFKALQSAWWLTLKCTKNVLLEIRNAHSIAKFHGFLNFSFDRGGIMHSSISRIRFRCDETLHSDWMMMWNKKKRWVLMKRNFECCIYFCERVMMKFDDTRFFVIRVFTYFLSQIWTLTQFSLSWASFWLSN
jgi:hypothetical protein